MVLAPSSKKQMVTNIDEWMSAFQTYVATYATRSPGDTPALMKYATVIRKLATSGANWKFYDENFRKLRESQGAPWDQILSELWLRSQFFRTTTGSQPKRAKHEGPYIPKGSCWRFHRGVYCSGCSYKHQCFHCGESHPVTKCQQPKPSPNHGKKLLLPTTEAIPTPVVILCRGLWCPLLWRIIIRFCSRFSSPFSGCTTWSIFGQSAFSIPTGQYELRSKICDGRIRGPFEHPPFVNLKVFPLRVISQKNSQVNIE